MTPEQKAIRAKVPPRSVHIVIFACGVMLPVRTRGTAALGRMLYQCLCVPPCGARIVKYTRGSLYGRGSATWPKASPSESVEQLTKTAEGASK